MHFKRIQVPGKDEIDIAAVTVNMDATAWRDAIPNHRAD
jgi:hypothetical protein